jgi:hypothetical protein
MLRFDPVLAAQSVFGDQAPPEGLRPGPCAMGPSPEHTPTSMHVWVFQQTADGLALASGDTRRNPVFADDDGPRWKVRTVLDPESRPFELDKPALATAIALLDGGADVLEWSQAVTIVRDSPFRGNPA